MNLESVFKIKNPRRCQKLINSELKEEGINRWLRSE